MSQEYYYSCGQEHLCCLWWATHERVGEHTNRYARLSSPASKDRISKALLILYCRISDRPQPYPSTLIYPHPHTIDDLLRELMAYHHLITTNDSITPPRYDMVKNSNILQAIQRSHIRLAADMCNRETISREGTPYKLILPKTF